MNDDELDKIIEREKMLCRYKGNDEIISNFELYDSIYSDLHTQQPVSMSSLIPTLDAHIKAFYGGELTVISGPTGNGKTLLAQTLTVAFAQQEKKMLWFTYEVCPYDFLNFFGLPLPLFYMPKELKESSLRWIDDRITEAKLKHGVDVVFIDHLHYLLDLGKNLNVGVEIGRAMRYLKLLAVNLNIHIFLLAHITKLPVDTEPDNNSLRDSSLVAQEAANIFFIWRLINTPDESMLKISKNRRFGVFNKYVHLIKHDKYLREVDKHEHNPGSNQPPHKPDGQSGRADIYS